MTSDLEQIAEEMGQAKWITDFMAIRRLDQWAARIRTWIAANKESPQRKAFVAEAIKYCEERHVAGRAPEQGRLNDFMSGMLYKYDAMIEAEKVEAERGQGT